VIDLTETWLKPDEFTLLNEASLGYTSDHILWASRKGRGVSSICDDGVQRCAATQQMTEILYFEHLVIKSMQPTQSLFIATVLQASWAIYSVPHWVPEFQLDLVVMADNIHIFGDFQYSHGKSGLFIVPSSRWFCVMIMLFNQLLDVPHLSGGWIIMAKEKCSLTGM
jgi:hypothetical protein